MADSATAENAITKALTGDWNEAVRINLALIKHDEKDINALNRLAFAYLQKGNVAQAKRWLKKVLEYDPYNQIALKNLKKLTTLKRKDSVKSADKKISPLHFLEEPGKTKIVNCVNLAPANVLATLSPGEEVTLRAKNHCIELRDSTQSYLGALPDDLSYKLIKLLTAGNQYQTIIKGVGKNALTVFVREIARGKRFANQPSFHSTSYIPLSRLEPRTQAPDVTPTGENPDDDLKAESPE